MTEGTQRAGQILEQWAHAAPVAVAAGLGACDGAALVRRCCGGSSNWVSGQEHRPTKQSPHLTSPFSPCQCHHTLLSHQSVSAVPFYQSG
ncbi:hypothetical protein AAFF_G00399270 [Aldrovandia affinis]|uniref:Uncharacterized protein n=1 Tax=Aldrovandia affinis TaxID=143900 RepID=A0AAD7SDF1_9TELE|nr:hypothetical protein AAFF_G00399270 [Aldrovandia affinis]